MRRLQGNLDLPRYMSGACPTRQRRLRHPQRAPAGRPIHRSLDRATLADWVASGVPARAAGSAENA